MGTVIGGRPRLARASALVLVAVAAAPAAHRAVARWQEAGALGDRIVSLVAHDASCVDPPIAVDLQSPDAALLSSWQTVGGCGAGAGTGTGAGVKWIGRNVTGGLFHVECQANYVKVPYGYNYIATTLLSRDLGPSWNLGVSVPYLYKYMNDPYGMAIDVSNQGLGDVNVLLGHRFGAIASWTATLSVGAPTGVHDATFRAQLLPQERQLGHGRPTASLMLDHTSDTDWGLTVLGGTVNWRGGENKLHSYRAPSASLYSHVGYVLGPLTPAVGLSVTGSAGHDRNGGMEQGTPLVSAAGSVSLEWATDWVAILLGASLPYDYVGRVGTAKGANGLGAWVVALGLAVAPF
jgi:hypothetical protein